MLSPGSLRIPLAEDDRKGVMELVFDSGTKLSKSGTSRRLERLYHSQKKRMNKINAKEPMMAPTIVPIETAGADFVETSATLVPIAIVVVSTTPLGSVIATAAVIRDVVDECKGEPEDLPALDSPVLDTPILEVAVVDPDLEPDPELEPEVGDEVEGDDDVCVVD